MKTRCTGKKVFASVALALIASSFICPTAASAQATSAEPNIEINIPTIKFTDIKVEDAGSIKIIDVPWIAQYISGLYKYMVAVAAVVASLVLVIGGFLWLTSGGDAARVEAAKRRISDAVLGLALILGTYLILNAVNPDLLKLNALQIIQINKRTFEGLTFEGKDPEDGNPEATTGSVAPAPSSNLEKIFQAYASCFGMDWRILKAVAQAESGLNSALVNKQGYKGLFQEKEPYCNGGIDPFSSLFNCSDLLDPEVNTAAAATIISRDLTQIKKACPNASVKETFLIVYTAHNNGPAVKNYILSKGACTEDRQRQAVMDYYNIVDKARREKANKPPCTRENALAKKCVDAEYGVKKWSYGNKVANAVRSAGVTNPFPTGKSDPTLCPKDTGKRVFPK